MMTNDERFQQYIHIWKNYSDRNQIGTTVYCTRMTCWTALLMNLPVYWPQWGALSLVSTLWEPAPRRHCGDSGYYRLWTKPVMGRLRTTIVLWCEQVATCRFIIEKFFAILFGNAGEHERCFVKASDIS
ncbi:hypothetical protein T09_8486 [Trichinella sp. T9]|nr:hypothetical protein T09_8486 [Trichinella sp. T9]